MILKILNNMLEGNKPSLSKLYTYSYSYNCHPFKKSAYGPVSLQKMGDKWVSFGHGP